PATRQRLQRQNPLQRETRQFLAVLAGRARQLDDAERLFRSCLEPAQLQRNEAEEYSGLPLGLKLAHKHGPIGELRRHGLEQAQNTNRVMFYVELSQALTYLGKMAEALAAANQAVDIAGEKERLWALRNRVYRLAEAEHYDEAVAQCEAMLREYTQADDVRD